MANNNELENIVAETAPADLKSSQEAEFLYREKKREEDLRVILHYITKIALVVVFVVIVIVLLIRVAHFILPLSCKWLDDNQLQTLDKFFFSGAIGSLLTKNMNKMFSS